jgi:uncharacterized protein (DUF983 family)
MIDPINFLQMLKKGSKLYSILTGSCPQCMNESMYMERNPLKFTKLLKLNANCSHCGLKYEIEPSFFYGALYVSYGLNVAIMIAVFLFCFFVLKANVNQTFVAIIGVLILFFPFVTRLARNIYINMFVKYKP